MRVHTLLRIDTQPIADHANEIRAFMVVRNEILRLAQNLDHHRKIGVARFFVVDNGSTDGSREFLLAQQDCHVLTTQNSFSEANCGVEWLNAVMDEYGANRWCLVVDADEWFIYPGYESQPLSEFAAYLDRSGAGGVLSLLMDMYSHNGICDTYSVSGRSLLELCRYFDNNYEWHKRFYVPTLQHPRFPEYDVVGGPRWRLLFPRLHRHYYLLETVWQITYFANVFTKVKLPIILRRPPLLTKIPFVRWLPGTRYLHNHATTPVKLSDVTGVLLHFKFLNDFYERTMIEVNRKQHWDHASEYVRYWRKLKDNPSLSFHHRDSVAFKDSKQLIQLGLLREDERWKQLHAVRDLPGVTPPDPRLVLLQSSTE